jgi:predicted Zn finger-like uncharacterized protein
MPASITCPGCKTTLRVREELAGKQVKCPRCAAVVRIPAREEVIEAEVAEREEGITEVKPVAKKKARASARRCPECDEPVPLSARKCPACKARLDEPEEDDRVDRDDRDDHREEERPRPKYQRCPRCGARGARRLTWTWWGSFYGPALFTHVRCPDCGYGYNGRTGGSNLIPAIVFVTIPAVIILGLLGFMSWVVLTRMGKL